MIPICGKETCEGCEHQGDRDICASSMDVLKPVIFLEHVEYFGNGTICIGTQLYKKIDEK